MLKGIFDEVDDHEEIEDLDGYGEESSNEEEEHEEEEEEFNTKKKRLSFNDYDEDLDSDEKRRLMSNGGDFQ